MKRAQRKDISDIEDLLRFLNRLGAVEDVSVMELSEPHTVVHVDSKGGATVTRVDSGEKFFLLSIRTKPKRTRAKRI